MVFLLVPLLLLQVQLGLGGLMDKIHPSVIVMAEKGDVAGLMEYVERKPQDWGARLVLGEAFRQSNATEQAITAFKVAQLRSKAQQHNTTHTALVASMLTMSFRL